jgi:hypothetical protein
MPRPPQPQSPQDNPLMTRLGRHGNLREVGQCLPEFLARADAELCEHLAQAPSGRGLMNSWVLISGLVHPSQASRTICAAPGVSSLAVSTVSPVASSSRLARSATSAPIAASIS